jgi:hypothetical protein
MRNSIEDGFVMSLRARAGHSCARPADADAHSDALTAIHGYPPFGWVTSISNRGLRASLGSLPTGLALRPIRSIP